MSNQISFVTRRIAANNADENGRITLDLPALDGSEKQVSWADDIRADKLPEVHAMPWQDEAQCDAVIAALVAETSAKAWIEMRQLSGKMIAMDTAKRLGLI